MKNHPFTLAMPPNNITILAICTVLCIMCRGRGVCKLVHHHIPNTKLTQRDNIIASRIAISYLHTDTPCTRASVLQYYVACKGLNVTATIHTAHAQKHFPPETKSNVRPKQNSPEPADCIQGTIYRSRDTLSTVAAVLSLLQEFVHISLAAEAS